MPDGPAHIPHDQSPALYRPAQAQAVERASRTALRAARAACRAAAPGSTTAHLAATAADLIAAHGARPAFPGYPPEHPDQAPSFPGPACISVNDEALHAPPGDRTLAPGDLVTVDVGVELDGWFADVAETVVVPGRDAPEAAALRLACRRAVAAAVRACAPGVLWSTVARTVRTVAARHDLAVLEGYAGHGIGRRLHESPAAGYAVRPGAASDFHLQPGMIFTIEPVLTRPPARARLQPDGWTLRTEGGAPAAHVERMVWVTETGCRVLGLPRAGSGQGDGL